MLEEKLNMFMKDIKKELDLIHYNQAMTNRSMVQLKKVFEFLQNSHIEDIRKFLENYRDEDSQAQISFREDDEKAKSPE